MRVGQTQRTGGAAPGQAARRPASSGGAFQPSFAAAPRKAAAARAAAPVGNVDVIVALQGVEDPAQRRKRAIRKADETLDILDELKLDLLAGRLSAPRLAQLKSLLRDGEDAEVEPELEQLLRGIDLRARVELAKLAKLDGRSG